MTTRLCGKVLRQGAGILLVFRVAGKYYPAKGINSELLETYLQTGNASYLRQLTNEVEA